jgi:hypothetical protein
MFFTIVRDDSDTDDRTPFDGYRLPEMLKRRIIAVKVVVVKSPKLLKGFLKLIFGIKKEQQ